MEQIIKTLSDANNAAQNLRSLNEILTRILEIEQNSSSGEILSVKVGTGADRIECGGGDVAIADSNGRRVTLQELIFAVEYVEFLRSRGITIDNLPNTVLGLSDAATSQVQALTALSGTNQILGLGYLGQYTLIPQSTYLTPVTSNNAVYRTDGTGNTYGEPRGSYQNQSSKLDSIAALSLSANKYLGTDGAGAIALITPPATAMPPRLVGEIQVVAFTVTTNPYIDENSWYWFVPDGTALSNANARYQQLYTKLWSTTNYTVSGGRGASAAADWSAGKSLQVPDMRGRAMAMAGQGSGLSNRAIASTWGAETAALAIANMPAHQHNISVTTITATGLAAGSSGYGVAALFSVATNQGSSAGGISGNNISANDGLGTIRPTGSGTAFSIVPPSIAMTTLIWLGTQ